MLATSDREAFVRKVHSLQLKALDRMVAQKEVQLRKGDVATRALPSCS